jgi:hypothetical protein
MDISAAVVEWRREREREEEGARATKAKEKRVAGREVGTRHTVVLEGQPLYACPQCAASVHSRRVPLHHHAHFACKLLDICTVSPCTWPSIGCQPLHARASVDALPSRKTSDENSPAPVPVPVRALLCLRGVVVRAGAGLFRHASLSCTASRDAAESKWQPPSTVHHP